MTQHRVASDLYREIDYPGSDSIIRESLLEDARIVCLKGISRKHAPPLVLGVELDGGDTVKVSHVQWTECLAELRVLYAHVVYVGCAWLSEVFARQDGRATQ